MSKRVLRPGPAKELMNGESGAFSFLDCAEAGYRQAIEQANHALRELLGFAWRKCSDPNYRHGISVALTRIDHLTPERGLYEEEKTDLAVEITASAFCWDAKTLRPDSQEVVRVRAALKRRGIEG